MKHTTQLRGFSSPGQFAEEFGNMRYDAMTEYLEALAVKLRRDSLADYERERYKLSSRLTTAAGIIQMLSSTLQQAWTICEPYEEIEQTNG
jgi:hypothetical protein